MSLDTLSNGLVKRIETFLILFITDADLGAGGSIAIEYVGMKSLGPEIRLGRESYATFCIPATPFQPILLPIFAVNLIAKIPERLDHQCKTVSIHFCDNVNSRFNLGER